MKPIYNEQEYKNIQARIKRIKKELAEKNTELQMLEKSIGIGVQTKFQDREYVLCKYYYDNDDGSLIKPISFADDKKDSLKCINVFSDFNFNMCISTERWEDFTSNTSIEEISKDMFYDTMKAYFNKMCELGELDKMFNK